MAGKQNVVPVVVIYVSEGDIRLVQSDREVDIYIVDYDCIEPNLPVYDISQSASPILNPEDLATVELAMAEVDPDAIDAIIDSYTRGPVEIDREAIEGPRA